jgi:uncharacterized protein (DUF1501 family)
MTLTRRNMMAMAAGTGLVPLSSTLRVGLAAEPGAQNNIFVFLFLRGGMDGLQLVAPADDAGYRDNRGGIGVRSSGAGSGYHLGALDGVDFFMHPRARQLKQMFDDKTLAIVHAAGVPTESRSHFESQALVDCGSAAREPQQPSGWLGRHLRTRPGPLGDFAATADVTNARSALMGMGGVLPITSLEYLPNTVLADRASMIAAVNGGDSPVARSARQTLRVLETVRERTKGVPRVDNPNYTALPLSRTLKDLARVIKFGLGLETAVVDYGAWDTHENIPLFFNTAAGELSNALFAFTDDLGPELMKRVTIVAATEFGRRVRENQNGGTDHGAASVMLALGAGVNGGRVYGQWPGLKDNQLDGGDLLVTTDYRQVLAEVLMKRMGQPAVENVFPTLAYKPLGLARG